MSILNDMKNYQNPGKLSYDQLCSKCLLIAFSFRTYAQASKSAMARGYASSLGDYDAKVAEAEAAAEYDGGRRGAVPKRERRRHGT